MITVYGIPNCDTVKKSRAWLVSQGLASQFHDFRKQGVPEGRLDGWIKAVGWEKLVNRQGTTWRKLDAAAQAGVIDAATAQALMLAHPSVIKRPVVDWGPGACRAWDVESENRPQRGQFLPGLQAHSPAMGQKDGEKWTAAADLQPTLPKPDRLLNITVGFDAAAWAARL